MTITQVVIMQTPSVIERTGSYLFLSSNISLSCFANIISDFAGYDMHLFFFSRTISLIIVGTACFYYPSWLNLLLSFSPCRYQHAISLQFHPPLNSAALLIFFLRRSLVPFTGRHNSLSFLFVFSMSRLLQCCQIGCSR